MAFGVRKKIQANRESYAWVISRLAKSINDLATIYSQKIPHVMIIPHIIKWPDELLLFLPSPPIFKPLKGTLSASAKADGVGQGG
jgi:hypothetical protein